MPDYRFRWNGYKHPALVAAFDMGTRTPGGLMKNLALTGSTYDATINGTFRPVAPLIKVKRTPCWDMDGVNDYMTLANPISGLSAFTSILWSNYDNFGGIWWTNTPTSTWIYIRANRYIEMGQGGGYNDTKPLYPIYNSYMIASVFTSNPPTGKLYVNGPLATFRSVTIGNNVVDATMYIGRTSAGGLKLDGRLDNMLFYNVALTPDQINSIYRSANPRL